jgi:hypothetical protein
MKFRHRLICIVLGLAAISSGWTPASAQEQLGGGYVTGSFPIGDWGKIAGFGVGLDGTDIIRLAPDKPFAWRLTTGLLYNFSRTVDVPPANLLPTSKLDLETKNWSLLFGVGPELAKRGGNVEPFLYGTVGFDTYWTSSTLHGTAAGLPYEAEHGDSRISFAWAGGLGIRRHVGGGYMGELSAEYRSGFDHQFLLPDEIKEDASGVHADRKSRSSDQILVRLGTVLVSGPHSRSR